MATVRATTSFATSDRAIHVGQAVDAADPIAVRFPGLFSAVEEATANPGERRSTPARPAPAKRAAKKAAPKTDD